TFSTRCRCPRTRMQTPFAIQHPVVKPRFFSSLGIKMLAVATLLLILAFGVCSAVLLLLTRRMLEDNLQSLVSRDSQFVVAISRNFLTNMNAAKKAQLSQIAKDLLKQPEIVAIVISDSHRRPLVHAAKPISPRYAPFTLQFPVLLNHRPVGWIRAWYSPG